MVGKAQRLTRRSEYEAVQRAGRSWANQLLVLKAIPNPLQGGTDSRIGFSVSKAVGKAVSRNRVRRRLKEIIQKLPLKQGWDVVVIARSATAEAGFQEMERAVAQLFIRAGLVEMKK